MDENVWYLTAEQFAAFKDALDAPAKPKPKLDALMRMKPPWDWAD